MSRPFTILAAISLVLLVLLPAQGQIVSATPEEASAADPGSDGTLGVCFSDTGCGPMFYCQRAVGNCNSAGTCVPRPTVCSWLADPVCGCDGQTYLNSCVAAYQGVSVAYHGACGASSPATIIAAISRKIHASAGICELDLLQPMANNYLAVEPRVGGPTEVIVTFNMEIQAMGGPDPSDVSLTSTGNSNGMVTSLYVGGNQLDIQLSDTSDAAQLTIAFPGITDLVGRPVTAVLVFEVLAGDANGDGMVNIFDLLLTRLELDQAVTPTNAGADVNTDGLINIFDLVDIRNNLDSVAP